MAVSRGGAELFVEVGTGRGNFLNGWPTCCPGRASCRSCFSPDQARIIEGLVARLGVPSVETCCGDICDPDTTDLVGRADTIRDRGHGPPPGRTQEGGPRPPLRAAPSGDLLSLMDCAVSPGQEGRPAVGQPQPLPRHPGQLFKALRAGGLGIEGYVNHTADALQTFIAPTTVLRQRRHLLRDEFRPANLLSVSARFRYVNLP